ncbi:hypothetical protein D3C77_177860 [compost metagenome]
MLYRVQNLIALRFVVGFRLISGGLNLQAEPGQPDFRLRAKALRGGEAALVIQVDLEFFPRQVEAQAGTAEMAALGAVLGLEPAVVQAQAWGDLDRQVAVQGQAQGVSPDRADGAGGTVDAVAAHRGIVGAQQLLDGRQRVRAVLGRELALPLPALLAPLAVAPLAEAGAVLAELRLGQVALQLLRVAIGAEPGQALGVIDIQVPYRAVEPEQVEPGLGHGQGRALDLQVGFLQVAVHILVGQLQVGAELVALVAPQHPVGAAADHVGAAAVVQGGAGQLERGAVFGVACEQAVGPITVGHRVEQAAAAAVARAVIEGVTVVQVQRVIDLQRAVQIEVDQLPVAAGAGAAEVIHTQPEAPARGAAARTQDDPRGTGLAAWGDVGGQVQGAQAVQLIQALLQVSQVQGLAEHARESPAQ